MKLILFVCTGNTCRSPMAEYYFNYKLRELNKSGENNLKYCAKSRGLSVGGEIEMSENSKRILLDNNIISNFGDFSDCKEILHKSINIDEEILNEALFVYGITQNHSEYLRNKFPKFKDKIRDLPENMNVGDPFGGSIEIYAKCFEKIKVAVDKIIEELEI